MASRRVAIAKKMAERKTAPQLSQSKWLTIIYAFEEEGFQVVKTEETAEYQGLRITGEK